MEKYLLLKLKWLYKAVNDKLVIRGFEHQG